MDDPRRSVARAALEEFGFIATEKNATTATEVGCPIDVEELIGVAIQEVASLGHKYVGPEHLLLALVNDRFREATSDYFRARSVAREMIRKQVLMILGCDDPKAGSQIKRDS